MGLAMLLAACRRSAEVINVTATTGPTSPPPLPTAPALVEGLPDIAGVLAALSEQSATLRAASGEKTVEAASAAVYWVDGTQIPLSALTLWTNVAAWGSGEPLLAHMIRELPPIAVLAPNPNPLPQPEPTGETTMLGPLTMITRAGWGAAEPQLDAPEEHGLFDPVENPEGWLVYPDPLESVLRTIIVHHSALEFPSGPRQIQEYHVRQRGYADIAYHYVIDSFGVLYEGRPIHARGAHTGGANTGSVGVVLLGNMSVHSPLKSQIETLGALVTTLKQMVGITHLAGHQDFQPGETVCPGEQMEPFLPPLAAAWGLEFGTGGYVTLPWATPDSL